MIRSLTSSLALLGILAAGIALVPAEPSSLPGLITEYRADGQSIAQAWRLPWSEVQNDRTGRHAGDWLKRLDAAPFESMAHDDQVDWLLLRYHLQQQVAELARDRKRLAEMESLLPFRQAIQRLETARLQGSAMDPAQAATEIAAQLKPLEALKKQLEDRTKQ